MKCKGHFCSNHTTLSFCSLQGTAPLFNYSVCFYIAAAALSSLISDTSPLCKCPWGWAVSPAGHPQGLDVVSRCWGERGWMWRRRADSWVSVLFLCWCFFRVWALQNVFIFGGAEPSCMRLMGWIGEGLEGIWGIPVLLVCLMGGWRWEAVGWEVASVWSLLTEEGNCL